MSAPYQVWLLYTDLNFNLVFNLILNKNGHQPCHLPDHPPNHPPDDHTPNWAQPQHIQQKEKEQEKGKGKDLEEEEEEEEEEEDLAANNTRRLLAQRDKDDADITQACPSPTATPQKLQERQKELQAQDAQRAQRVHQSVTAIKEPNTRYMKNMAEWEELAVMCRTMMVDTQDNSALYKENAALQKRVLLHFKRMLEDVFSAGDAANN